MEALDINLSPFFGWLLRTTIQGSILICLILMVKAVLRHKLPVRWHYYLWLLLLVRLALPWSPQSRISIFNLMPQSASQQKIEAVETIDQSSEGIVQSDGSVSDNEQSEPAPDQTIAVGAVQSESLPAPDSVTETVTTKVDKTPPVVIQQSRLQTYGLSDILPLIWLAGALILAGYILLRNIILWKAIKSERQVTDQDILELLEDCKMQMRIQTVVGVVVTDKVKSPALFGFIRPRLLLPQGLLEELDLDELQYVFLHELAHLRRRDIYFGWIVSLLQVVHWFNPLIWFAFRRMRTDQELACDALALSTMSSEEPLKYGKTLVNLFERFSQVTYVPSIAGILEDKSELERRIQMISQFKKDSYQWSIPAIIILAMLCFVTLTNGRTMKGDSSALVQIMPEDLYKNLILYYSFDKDGGTKSVDISGMDFHGKVHEANWIEEGLVGGAMSFDGEDDYISVPDIRLRQFSFTAWIKTPLTEGAANNRRIFLLSSGGGKCYALQGNAGGSIGIYVSDDIEVNEYNWQLKRSLWTHIAVTHDGHTFKIYRNGKLTETGDIETEGVSGTLYIGGTNERNGSFWCGSIDEVAVFNRALSDEKVRQVFEMTRSIDEIETTSETKNLKRFTGQWTGLAVDKPEDGTSRYTLTLNLRIDESGQLAGEVIGQFAWDGFCELKNLKITGDRICFEVRHQFKKMRMGVKLELKGEELIGEGLPIDIIDDRCDITLRRVSTAESDEFTSVPVKRGPVLYYSFDRDEGQTVMDQSGEGHHGSVHGAKFESEGKIGGAMSFNGEGDYISVPDINLRQFSFTAWIKTPLTGGAANNRRIFLLSGSGGKCYALQGNAGGSIGVYVADDLEVNEYDWQLGRDVWTHVAVTHDGHTFKIYRNGKLTETGDIEIEGVSGTLYIGGTNERSGDFWCGGIDEVAVFNRVLNDEEIKQVYEKGGDKVSIVDTKSVNLAGFVGTWKGMATDKPEDGSSRDPLRLELRIDETGRLIGEVFDGFVYNDNCKVKNLRVDGNQIYFEIEHRIEGMRMGITLNIEGDTLFGEGIPIGVNEDRCDIILEREMTG